MSLSMTVAEAHRTTSSLPLNLLLIQPILIRPVFIAWRSFSWTMGIFNFLLFASVRLALKIIEAPLYCLPIIVDRCKIVQVPDHRAILDFRILTLAFSPRICFNVLLDVLAQREYSLIGCATRYVSLFRVRFTAYYRLCVQDFSSSGRQHIAIRVISMICFSQLVVNVMLALDGADSVSETPFVPDFLVARQC